MSIPQRAYHPEDVQLLRDCLTHLEATRHHWGLLPESSCAAHLGPNAKSLAKRIRDRLPKESLAPTTES